MARDFTIAIECRNCKQITKILLDESDLHKWQNGELIQNALPYLNENQRELMISRICGKCFDKMFDKEE